MKKQLKFLVSEGELIKRTYSGVIYSKNERIDKVDKKEEYYEKYLIAKPNGERAYLSGKYLKEDISQLLNHETIRRFARRKMV